MSIDPFDPATLDLYFAGVLGEEESFALEEIAGFSDDAFLQLTSFNEPLRSITPENHGQAYRDTLAERTLREARRLAEERGDRASIIRFKLWLENFSSAMRRWSWTSVAASRSAVNVAEIATASVRISEGEFQKVLRLAGNLARLEVVLAGVKSNESPIAVLGPSDGSVGHVTAAHWSNGVAVAEFKNIQSGEYLLLVEPLGETKST